VVPPAFAENSALLGGNGCLRPPYAEKPCGGILSLRTTGVDLQRLPDFTSSGSLDGAALIPGLDTCNYYNRLLGEYKRVFIEKLNS